MKHYGDITKINGAEIEPVDVITGGSPCQDLSIAGNRAGLAGERSGLFMEQVRIVKEMRAKEIADGRPADLIRPRFLVWENVPGAFTSNGGKDFQAVLTEIVRIVEPNAPDVPMPEGGRWSKSGCLYGEMGDWSIAWRVHDAQFWGVPQRRKRIALVADFGGCAAPEVLFERKGVSRDTEQGESAGKGTAGDSSQSVGAAISFQERAGKPGDGKGILIQNERACSVRTQNNQSVCINGEVSAPLDGHYYLGCGNRGGVEREVVAQVYDARGNGNGKIAPTITGDHQDRITDYMCIALDGNGSRESHKGIGFSESDVSYTLNSVEHHAVCIGNGQVDQLDMHDKVGALNCMHDQQAVMCYGLDRASYNQGKNAQFDFTVAENQQPTLVAKGPGAVCDYYVRRLTPTECERLQGYPDGWTDIGEWTDSKGKKHQTADSARYKALGNSLALPYWKVLARRIAAQYDRDITMGSLFDGISGFCLAFAHCGAKPIWASEVDEFCIAVAKKHFPEKEDTNG